MIVDVIALKKTIVLRAFLYKIYKKKFKKFKNNASEDENNGIEENQI